MYYWSDRPILCGNLIEFDEKKCLYSRSFRFYKHSMLVRKTWDTLHTKNMFAAFPLFIANADKIQKYKNRMIFRDKEASFVNRNILIDIPYFDIPTH